jgi:hypothetical protein
MWVALLRGAEGSHPMCVTSYVGSPVIHSHIHGPWLLCNIFHEQSYVVVQFAFEKTIAIASPVAKDKGSQTRTLKHAHAQQVVSLARASCAPPPLSGRPWAGPRVPVGGAAAPWGLRRFSPSWPLGGGVLRLTSFFDQLLSIGTSYVLGTSYVHPITSSTYRLLC